MKLYTGRGPNPRAVRIALAEKAIAYEAVEIDILKNESRTGDFVARVNPAGTIPALEDGEVIVSEVGAIAEYLDEVSPTTPLIGANTAERAATRMWARRLDLDVCVLAGTAFQGGAMRAFFEGKKMLAPEGSAPAFIAMAHARMEWLEGELGGRDWVCGDRFSWADVPMFCYVDFFSRYGAQTYPRGGWFEGWMERMRARPSAAA